MHEFPALLEYNVFLRHEPSIWKASFMSHEENKNHIFYKNIMKRYLLNISYIGTNFRGIQKTINKVEEARVDTKTVQGCLEFGLQIFQPKNEINVVLSSRTDAGVHALQSSVHVDLESNGRQINPVEITVKLNKSLAKNEFPIRVINTIQVPETFHCRYNALGRTYLYRLAVAKETIRPRESLRILRFTSFIPIEELDRCFFIPDSYFDIEKVHEAAKLLIGRHDFRTFMSTNGQNSKQKNARFTLRTIEEITITPGNPVTNIFDIDKANNLYNYWDIKVTGKSFLYKQVRRIVGSLISVACGKITIKDIYEMLTIPSKHSWANEILVVPAYGLYLCRVHYNENDFILPSENLQDEQS